MKLLLPYFTLALAGYQYNEDDEVPRQLSPEELDPIPFEELANQYYSYGLADKTFGPLFDPIVLDSSPDGLPLDRHHNWSDVCPPTFAVKDPPNWVV